MTISKRILKPAVTLFVMSAALFSGSLWTSVQSATGASPQLKFPPITITFGRASKKCSGFGLCKITIGKVAPSLEARSVKAELTTTDDGKLQLTLLAKAPEEGRTLFVDEDIPLSSQIAQRLGVRSATIRKGEYAFSDNKSVLNARLTR